MSPDCRDINVMLRVRRDNTGRAGYIAGDAQAVIFRRKVRWAVDITLWKVQLMTVIWLFADCRWQRFEDDGFDAENTRKIVKGQIDGYAEHIV